MREIIRIEENSSSCNSMKYAAMDEEWKKILQSKEFAKDQKQHKKK